MAKVRVNFFVFGESREQGIRLMVMVKVVHQLALGPEFAREVRAVLSANLEPIPTSLPRPPHCPRTHMLSAKARYRVDGILERLNVKT